MTSWTCTHVTIEGMAGELDVFEALATRWIEPEPPRPHKRTAMEWLLRVAPPAVAPPSPLAGRVLDEDRILPEPDGLTHEAAQAWRIEHRGSRGPLETTSYARTPDGRISFRTWTPWSAPFALFRALAPRLPPALVVAGANADDATATGARFRIERGVFTEWDVPYDAALWEEVHGETADPDLFVA